MSALLVSAFLLSCLWLASSNGLWFAEALSIELSEYRFLNYWGLKSQLGSPARDQAPLYYSLMGQFRLLFGEIFDWRLRIPGIALASLSLAISFLFLRRKNQQLMTFFLLLLSNSHFLFTTIYFRHYILALSLTTALYIVANSPGTNHLRTERPKALMSGLLFTLSVLTSLPCILLLPALCFRFRRSLAFLLLPSAAGISFLLKKALPFFEQRILERTASSNTFFRVMTSIFSSSEFQTPFLSVTLVILYTLLIALILYFTQTKEADSDKFNALFFVPSFILLIAISLMHLQEIDGRYLFHFYPAFLLFVMGRFHSMQPFPPKKILRLCIALIVVCQCILSFFTATELKSLISHNQVAQAFVESRFSQLCFNPPTSRDDVLFSMKQSEREVFAQNINRDCKSLPKPTRFQVHVTLSSTVPKPEDLQRIKAHYELILQNSKIPQSD